MRTMTKIVMKEEGESKMQWSKNHIGVQVGPGVMYKILQKMSCSFTQFFLSWDVGIFVLPPCWALRKRHLRTCQGQWRSREGTEGNTETSREGQGKSRGGAFGLPIFGDVRKKRCLICSMILGVIGGFLPKEFHIQGDWVASASPAGSL